MSNWKLPLEGSCRCGRIELRIDAPPLLTAVCHCTGCQRMTSSAFSLGAAFATAALSTTGDEPVIGGLHGATRHYFCGHCKSWLFTRPDQLGDIVMVRTTLLDDQRGLEPFMETMTCEKLDWVTTPARRSFETWPPPAAMGTLLQEFAESRQ
jgi:hypothetical protein